MSIMSCTALLSRLQAMQFKQEHKDPSDLQLGWWQPGPPWHVVWCRYPGGSCRSDRQKQEVPCGTCLLLFWAPRGKGSLLHLTARTGRLPEHKIHRSVMILMTSDRVNYKALKFYKPPLLVNLGLSGAAWWQSGWRNWFAVSCAHSGWPLSAAPPSDAQNIYKEWMSVVYMIKPAK